jgi:alkylation response protein AidB-like acyl-CoA dehydrogenase
MRLAPDESLSDYRRGLETWIDANLPTDRMKENPRKSSAHLPDWARVWQRALFDEGWLVPAWPPELGGRNATPEQVMAYFEVMAAGQVPRALNPQGISICSACIVDYGTPEQIERFAVPTLKGEITWCVGMSEPGAGSDLASLSTRAELQGEHFVVNGQKVWTSGAHDADFCMCFVRTNPDAPKHRGISVLIIDMRSEGIECRPLPELTDPHHADFDEVFFTDVVVPADQLLGGLDNGWMLAQGSLRHERAMLWVMNTAKFERTVQGLVRLAGRDNGAGGHIGDDDKFAEAVASLAMDAVAMRCLGYRGFAKATQGEMAPEHMLLKLFASEAERRADLLAVEALGTDGVDVEGPGPGRWTEFDVAHFGEPPVDPGLTNAFDDGAWVVQYLRSFSNTIAGGTSEIQRNILAERVLGLPRG